MVHREKFMVDQWTGESVKKRFKIPRKGLKTWGGCYGTPGTAVAGIVAYSESESMTQEETQELIDMFQASLRREVGHELDKHTIVTAPSYKTLVSFGGNTPLEAYNKQYDHDAQVAIYRQEILVGKEEEETTVADKTAEALQDILEGTSLADVKPAPEEGKKTAAATTTSSTKSWFVTEMSDKGDVGESTTRVPRGLASFMSFIKSNVTGQVATVYFHPAKEGVFAVGGPWIMTDYNANAAEAMGGIAVSGNVKLYHGTKGFVVKTKAKKRSAPADKPKKKAHKKAKTST